MESRSNVFHIKAASLNYISGPILYLVFSSLWGRVTSILPLIMGLPPVRQRVFQYI